MEAQMTSRAAYYYDYEELLCLRMERWCHHHIDLEWVRDPGDRDASQYMEWRVKGVAPASEAKVAIWTDETDDGASMAVVFDDAEALADEFIKLWKPIGSGI
jgi:hypothetical protein